MIKETVSIDEVIDLLNGAIESDRSAMQNLANARVQCNEELSLHETIQVGVVDGKFRVGLIGILNGIFGMNEEGCGPIGFQFNDDNGELINVFRLDRREEG